MINPAMLPNVAGGQSVTGEMNFNDVGELRKALEAGYGTDVSTLTGGGALRIQSLEKTLMATIQENEHFALFNELQKTNATATIDEWTEQNGIGGFLGGSTNSETGAISNATGSYARRTGAVKYLMTRREVSFVTTLQNSIVEAEATEQQNGALQLLTDAEYLSFEGDSSIVPTEFDGIAAQMVGLGSSDHVLDAQAASLSSINLINKAAATVSAYGNFGKPSHLFMSQLAQADFDTGLDPAFRVALDNQPNSIMLGAPVAGIRTSWGNIKTKPDVFIRDEAQQKPFQISFAALAAANNFAPAAAAGVAAADVSSMFGAPHAGNYYYFVTGVNAAGQSVGVASAQVAVAAGDKVTLTITVSATGSETGYVIYRSRKNGTAAADDVRQCVRVARTGASTVWVDLNRDIPGTSKAYILNLSPGANAVSWRQLLPMLKFPLYPTVSAVVPWAQLLFGYLRVAKRRHNVVIKNILPNGATWRPFGV
jgi:hypothetical protein